MPEITHGWARFNLADAADRKQLIENGVIWQCGQKAAQMAFDDLVAGMVPMNDLVPPEVAAIIQKAQAARSGMTPLVQPGDAVKSAAPDVANVTSPVTPGWVCPNGHATVNILTSRKGRVYGMCTTCHAFEGGDVLPNAATPVPASVPDPKVDPKRPEPSAVPPPLQR